MFCDLHMHSTASDGTDAPSDIPALAREAGLAAIALTDHDTTDGLAACAKQCAELDIAFVPGIELSIAPHDLPGKRADNRTGTLHILGYYIDPDHPKLIEIQQRLIHAREQRNPQIIENLNELGVKISYDDVLKLAAEQNASVVGRPHIAQVLVNLGYVRTIHQAFAEYVGEGAAAYARKDQLSPEEAIDTLHQANGLAVLAHPVQLRRATPADLEADVNYLTRLGLDGIETRHTDHTPQDVDMLTKLAQRYDLIPTGGSDYHGSNKTIPLNNCRVPFEIYTNLQNTKNQP